MLEQWRIVSFVCQSKRNVLNGQGIELGPGPLSQLLPHLPTCSYHKNVFNYQLIKADFTSDPTNRVSYIMSK